ncbi:hypothetical protein RM697_00250 [Ichthyenterobacterium sp. W332]|uniref:TonB C-terminal domain-containing protein n=1 Tax=Microcosmobacter mediterraneus TaxID=3075607 RepID=A0ABU2YJ16_9FLAO|nr:hypothetical protein [Ichthyenterobacterium sp. W332]MDT0557053.1 hypothetical protein [Ichthyenterobacterium sp. W332]
MKKQRIIIVTTLLIICVLIFGFTNLNSSNTSDIRSSEVITIAVKDNSIPDLYYGIDTRFAAVKKVDVHNASTIYDFLNDGEKDQIEHINFVRITIVKDNQLSHVEAYGTNEQLTNTQLEILRATDYFSHFTVRTEFKAKNKETGKLEERFFGPHITVVPEKQAIYSEGKDALIEYLKVNSKESMKVIKGDKLGAIKLSFIVSKEGIVKNVKHDAMTTGYQSIDKKLMTLLKNIPGEWIPAETAKGVKIDQEFAFTFGPRDGC